MFSRLFRRARTGDRIRMANIYRRRGKDYVTASSLTSDGFWLEEGAVQPLDSGDPAVAGAVRSASPARANQ